MMHEATCKSEEVVGKISLIVPVYNSEKYLEECIESIMSQRYCNFEAILINDGSTDASLSILKRFANCDRRLRIVDQANSGVSSARNAGLESATGEWLAFIDSDDVVGPDYLNSMILSAIKNDADLVVGGYGVIGKENSKVVLQNKLIEPSVLSPVKALERMLYQDGLDTAPWGKLYKRKLFEGIFFPNIRSSEDLATIYKVFINSTRVLYLFDTGYRYRKTVGSLSYSSGEIDSLNIVETAFEDILDRSPSVSYACSSRRMSYYSHLLVLCDDPDQLADLWNRIRSCRHDVIVDPKARKKAKIAAFVSIFGLRVFTLLDNLTNNKR